VPAIGAFEVPDHYDLGMPGYTITEDDRRALTFVRSEPSGVGGAALTTDQQEVLWRLIDCYLDRLPPESAATPRGELRAQEIGSVHFSWAGAERRGAPHYFRVQTDHLLIEAVNAVGGGNHLHTVLRDFDNDFGRDLLATQAGIDSQWGTGHLDTRRVSSAAAEPH